MAAMAVYPFHICIKVPMRFWRSRLSLSIPALIQNVLQSSARQWTDAAYIWRHGPTLPKFMPDTAAPVTQPMSDSFLSLISDLRASN